MKTAQLLAAIVVASGIPLVAQQPGSAPTQEPPSQQTSPSQQAPPAQESTPQATTPGAPSSPAAQAPEMKPVSGELVDNLDSKTAKTGDTVTIETKQAVTTADGAQIPQGSKIVGHVLGVKASGQGNENSQVALAFDRAELKGGQSLALKTELRSLSPAGTAGSAPNSMGAAPGSQAPGTGAPNSPGSASPGSTAGSASPEATAGSSAGQPPSQGGNVPGTSQGNGSAAAAGSPLPAGVVVARTGNIDIKTTAIPGVLLANNQPGMQDPRMAQSSGILLGARRDIHLDGGTQVVIAVAGSGTTGGGN